MPNVDTSKCFILYMGLSSITSVRNIPLKVKTLRPFFDCFDEDTDSLYFEDPHSSLYPLYSMYISMPVCRRRDSFQKVKKNVPRIFGSYTHFKNRYQSFLNDLDWAVLVDIISKWDLKKEILQDEELYLLIRIGYKFPEKMGISWAEFPKLEPCSVGCKVVNVTAYPNWVFALAYLQDVQEYLSVSCPFTVHLNNVFFEFYNELGEKKYRFPLLNIRLVEDGFAFLGEHVENVHDFYKITGLINKCPYVPTDHHSTDSETLPMKRKNSENRTDDPKRQKIVLDALDLIDWTSFPFPHLDNAPNTYFDEYDGSIDHILTPSITEVLDETAIFLPIQI